MREDIIEILCAAAGNGALAGVVTNGYTMTPQMVPRVVELGLSNINISIDSLDPQVLTTYGPRTAKGTPPAS